MKLELDVKKIEKETVEQAAYQIVDQVFEGHDLEKRVNDLVEEKVLQHCDSVVAPIIEEGVKSHIIQLTNTFGEKKGEPKTFTEYLVERAESYLTELVDYQGKEVNQRDSWARDRSQARLTFLIDKNLKYKIASAVEEVAKGFDEVIGEALSKTVKEQASGIVRDLKLARARR